MCMWVYQSQYSNFLLSLTKTGKLWRDPHHLCSGVVSVTQCMQEFNTINQTHQKWFASVLLAPGIITLLDSSSRHICLGTD